MAIFETLTSSNSRAISNYGYNVLTRHLQIHFRSGGIYTYDDVPLAVYSGFIFSSSKGDYFNSNIRNEYTFRKEAG